MFIFAATVGILGLGLYLQHVKGLEPCPLCILQRYAFVVAGLVALVAGLHNPGRGGSRAYASALGLASILGAGIAARQAWMQRFPPKVSECGPDFDFMVGNFPLAESLPMIFKGGGDCSKILWTFMGLTIPEFALIFFISFILAAFYVAFRRERR